jgi:hypothetical protein
LAGITRAQEVLGAVETCPAAESVFEKYDEQAGERVCCRRPFQSVGEVAIEYSIDLDALGEDPVRAAT